MSRKKKIIVLTSMIVLLVATAVLNFVLTSGSVKTDDPVAATSYLTEYRNTLKTTRNEQLIQIDEILANGEDGSDAKKDALALKLKLTEAIEIEPRLEYLIKAKGYEDVAVSLSVTSGSYTVLVKDEDFNLDDAVSIYSIMKEEANATPDKVFIQKI